MKTVTIKMCGQLQTFVWADGGLLRAEDQNEARYRDLEMDFTTEPKSLLSRLADRLNILEWITFKWLYQHSPNPKSLPTS